MSENQESFAGVRESEGYTIAKSAPLSADRIYCLNAVAAIRIDADFAARLEFVPHPSGEDLYIAMYVLDHVPSGFRAGANFNSVAEAEKRVAILRRTPVDWSSERPEAIDKLGGFIVEAEKRDGLSYSEWVAGSHQ